MQRSSLTQGLRTPFLVVALVATLFSGSAIAADWADTAIGVRYGSRFDEPYNGRDIKKGIVNFSHASGYKYGSNFFNVDFLASDAVDSSAQEVYVVYRHTLDLGKLMSKSLAFGPIRAVGLTGGFDVNTKNDPGYASRKRMLVLGPTLMLDVPGFLDVSLLLLKESNFPNTISTRYEYDLHPMLNIVWGLPLGGTGLSFEGFAAYIAAKGRNEFGGGTAPELNVDAQLMYDFSPLVGATKKTFRGGVGYQYWRNKFGNPHDVPGALARTPMIRADYHF